MATESAGSGNTDLMLTLVGAAIVLVPTAFGWLTAGLEWGIQMGTYAGVLWLLAHGTDI